MSNWVPNIVFGGSNEAATEVRRLKGVMVLEASPSEISGNLEEIDSEKITLGRDGLRWHDR